MNKHLTLLSISIAACLPHAASAGVGPDKFRTVAKPVQGEYIVVLKDEPAPFGGRGALLLKPAADEAVRMAKSHRFTVDQVYEHVLRGFAIRANDAALARVLADPAVDYVEEIPVMTAQATQSNAPWHLDRIDQLSLPLNTTFNYTRTGAGSHVFVMDAQINKSHTEFPATRVRTGYNTTGETGTCTTNSHGSSVAGVALGTKYGVAKGAILYDVQVIKCNGSISGADLIEGLDWIYNGYRTLPAVVNMSLSGGRWSTLDATVNKLIDAGVVVVAAAGNDSGSDACNLSPAGVPRVLTVAATNASDERWAGSNIGSCVDIFAPGTGIISATSANNTGTSNYSGTSQAAPMVTGAVAMYMQLWWSQYKARPSVEQVRSALINNSSAGKVKNPGTGSPNYLLRTQNF